MVRFFVRLSPLLEDNPVRVDSTSQEIYDPYDVQPFRGLYGSSSPWPLCSLVNSSSQGAYPIDVDHILGLYGSCQCNLSGGPSGKYQLSLSGPVRFIPWPVRGISV